MIADMLQEIERIEMCRFSKLGVQDGGGFAQSLH